MPSELPPVQTRLYFGFAHFPGNVDFPTGRLVDDRLNLSAVRSLQCARLCAGISYERERAALKPRFICLKIGKPVLKDFLRVSLTKFF